MSLPPPPPTRSKFDVISVDSLEAALKKLDANIALQDILDAIHEEDERRAVQVEERHAAVTELTWQPAAGLEMTTVSEFIANPPEPIDVDPLREQRRRRLLELTKEAFPDGIIPNPFVVGPPKTWLGLSKDAAANKLPFILATQIVITNAEETSRNPPQSVFTNVWCLWDTGAQTSFVVTSQLNRAVTKGKTEGSCFMEISFANVKKPKPIDSVIHFRPQLPNGATFIILGQHALLNCIQYSIQPAALDPSIRKGFPNAYGLITLEKWADPAASNRVVPFEGY
ncbi:hypothetical protein MIND_00419300 [Mycena indigotica]|uniref:Uncharacterized protein n=1 Tax=Mycena indigotica TaxID=2126181 RepID=A0A8H6W594_9AGAR|nr:uncharacterized protein MIND_00419300 [Mycena indigotica]KAF7306284.1 hypothetical protein MIND_00419300 [Mycena indigotica]